MIPGASPVTPVAKIVTPASQAMTLAAKAVTPPAKLMTPAAETVSLAAKAVTPEAKAALKPQAKAALGEAKAVPKPLNEAAYVAAETAPVEAEAGSDLMEKLKRPPSPWLSLPLRRPKLSQSLWSRPPL